MEVEVDVSEMERLLRSALVPVEPPGSLTDRMEKALIDLAEAAADELADWELSAMRNPRNWVRPAAAVIVGGTAAGGLILVRARQRQRARDARGLRALGRGARDVRDQVRRRLRKR
jgi:hypothetical protein